MIAGVVRVVETRSQGQRGGQMPGRCGSRRMPERAVESEIRVVVPERPHGEIRLKLPRICHYRDEGATDTQRRTRAWAASTARGSLTSGGGGADDARSPPRPPVRSMPATRHRGGGGRWSRTRSSSRQSQGLPALGRTLALTGAVRRPGQAGTAGQFTCRIFWCML